MKIFNKKKPVAVDVETNLSKLNDLSVQANHLVYLTNDETIKQRLRIVNENIKYLPPTKKVEMLKLEEQIGNKLGDLKIQLSIRNDLTRINQIIQEIDHLLIERKNKF